MNTDHRDRSAGKRRGCFITLEGVDGAGKSTQISAIKDHLSTQGITVRVTREPGGTELGERLRSLLLDAKNLRLDTDTELLLMFAARAQHISEVIEPSLASGEWVVSDRFTEATYAYQGGGRGVVDGRIQMLETWVQGAFRPDLTLVLDLPVETGIQRIAGRGEGDRFETLNLAFKTRVRDYYLEMVNRYPDRMVCIDASANVSQVTRQVLEAIDHKLNLHG